MNASSDNGASRFTRPRTLIVVSAAAAGLLALGLALQTSRASVEPALSVRNVTVTEGDEEDVSAKVRVVLSESTERTVYVDYETEEGTAKSPSDFTDRSGTIRFLPGQTVRSVKLTINSDTREERTEYFRLLIEDPVNATISDASGKVTILDNDGEDRD